MMVISFLMMDVMNVSTNVKINVLIVEKEFVMLVLIEDGCLIQIIFVQITAEMESLSMDMNYVMMVMKSLMMVAINVNFNANCSAHYAIKEFVMNVTNLDGVSKIINALLFVVMEL